MDTCEAWRGYGEVASQIGYRSYRLWQASLMSYAMTIARAGCTRRRRIMWFDRRLAKEEGGG